VIAEIKTGRLLRGHLVPLVLWTVVWGIFFFTLLIGIDRIPNGDFSGQFHAFGLFQASEFSDGRLPVWSPGSYAGFPFASDPQAAVFYPPRWITILLTLPWQFTYYALTLEALIHVWLAGLFTYLLAFDMTGRRGPALVAAFAFGLGGYLVSYPIQQLAILESMTWLPLLLLLLRRGVLYGADRRYLLAAALVLGLVALAGHPQSLLHVAYVAIAYFLFLAWRARWRLKPVAGIGLLLAAVALGVAAAAWLPAARYVVETTRSAAPYSFVSTGFPLLDFFQIVIPGALTVWSPQYAGLATLVLVFLAWFGRRWATGSPHEGEVAFWSVLALFAALLSLGDSGILFELVYRIAPGFSLFRQQERLAGVFSLSLALLAAQGLSIWLQIGTSQRPPEASERPTRPALWLTTGLLVLAGITFFVARTLTSEGWWLVWLRQMVLINFIALALLALRHRPYVAMSAILMLLVTDLFLSTHPSMGLADESPAVFWPAPDWLVALQAEQPGRIDTQNLFHANVGEIYNLEDIRGISPLKPAVVEQYEALPRRLRWQLLNVTHVLTAEQVEEGLTPVMPATDSVIPGESLAATLYRFDDALPRVWMAYEVQAAQNQAEALALIQDPAFDPAQQVVLVAGEAAQFTDTSPPVSPASVQVAKAPGGGLYVVVDTAVPGILVISEWHRPGWQALLANGETLPLMEANGGLMAVPVPAGRNDLSLRYWPWEVPAGIAISLMTLVAVFVVARRWRPVISPLRPAYFPATLPSVMAHEQKTGLSVITGVKASWRWLLVLILLAGFGLRVYRLGHQELRGDEAFSFGFVQLPVGQVFPEIIEQGDPHSPLPYLVLNIWTDMAGISELSLRYLSVLAGTLLLGVIYALGRRMGGQWTGFLAAGLAAMAPGLIWLSQDGRTQYMMVTLFSALATLIIVHPPPRRAVGYWGLYLAACLLTVYSHYYGIFALVSHGLYLWLTPGRWRQVVVWTGCGVATMLGLGIWLVVAARSVLQAGHLADPAQPELARHLVLAGRELAIGSTLGSQLDRWLFLGGLLLALMGGLALVRLRRSNWATMLLVWLGLGVYAIFLIRFGRGTFNPYYTTILAPAWWLLISAALAWLWAQGGRRRSVAAIALLIFAAAVLVALRNYYFDPLYGRSLGYRAVAAHLAQQAGSGDLFIVPYPDPVWNYYLRDSDLPRRMLPDTVAATAEETEDALAAVAQQYDRLWFIPYEGWDRSNVVGPWLDYHTLREEWSTHGRTDLRAYRPLSSAAAVMTPLDHPLGEELRLSGAYLTSGGFGFAPGEIMTALPGTPLEVTLLWEAFRPSLRSYTTFVHLLDGNGRLIAQHDGIPAEGTRPTTTWQAGERLLDRHGLVVPEAATGPMTLVVGLYDSETVERQVFESGLTAIRIAEFLVTP
jgi:hypothetical protein